MNTNSTVDDEYLNSDAARRDMAAVSTLFFILYIPMALYAHYSTCYEISLCCCIGSRPPRGRCAKRVNTMNRRLRLFFPTVQCIVMMPIVQSLCIWRTHKSTPTNEVILLTWTLVLFLGCSLSILSQVWTEYRTYYAHLTTQLMLVPGFILLFDGALRVDAAGDIAAACLLVICSVAQIFPPYAALKDSPTLFLPSSDNEAEHRPVRNGGTLFTITGDDDDEDFYAYDNNDDIVVESGKSPKTFNSYPTKHTIASNIKRKAQSSVRAARDRWRRRGLPHRSAMTRDDFIIQRVDLDEEADTVSEAWRVQHELNVNKDHLPAPSLQQRPQTPARPQYMAIPPPQTRTAHSQSPLRNGASATDVDSLQVTPLEEDDYAEAAGHDSTEE